MNIQDIGISPDRALDDIRALIFEYEDLLTDPKRNLHPIRAASIEVMTERYHSAAVVLQKFVKATSK